MVRNIKTEMSKKEIQSKQGETRGSSLTEKQSVQR